MSAPVPFADRARVLQPTIKVLAAGANLHRLLILQFVARTARSTAELAGLLGITASAVSQHLKILREAQLVQPRRRGHEVLYSLHRSNPELERLLAAVPEILR